MPPRALQAPSIGNDTPPHVFNGLYRTDQLLILKGCGLTLLGIGEKILASFLPEEIYLSVCCLLSKWPGVEFLDEPALPVIAWYSELNFLCFG